MAHSQFFLWMPLFLSAGTASYFALPFEPPLLIGVLSCIFCILCYSFWRNILIIALLFMCAGFAAAQWRTLSVHTPMLERELGTTALQGVIDEVEYLPAAKGLRLTLSSPEVEKLAPEETPRKVRLTYRAKAGKALPAYRTGDTIKALAALNPPSAPIIPEGFNFRRFLYFKSIGAIGFIYTQPEIIKPAPQQITTISRMRQTITQRIYAAMPNPGHAGIATALLTGQRTGIRDADSESFRVSGLAHLLAISGLHVGLFSGFVFFLLRFMLAAIPHVALYHPVKKYAAVIAFIAAAFYTLIAGATIPTQRALLMTGIVFLAIILDRSPISLRLVSFSAFIVLLFSPESLLSASFQLSFAAVTGLVLFYEHTRNFWSNVHNNAGILRRVALYFMGVCITSVIATLCTVPFALYHFNRLAAYGLLANLLAVPAMSILIMPSALAALLFMPLQIERFPLKIMDQSIYAVLQVARMVESMPKSSLYVASPNMPDILISDDFKTIMLRDQEGELHVSSRRANRFEIGAWESHYGQEEGSAKLWPYEGKGQDIHCDAEGCRTMLKNRKFSFIESAQALGAECLWADFIVVKTPVRKAQRLCANTDTKIIHRFDGSRWGVHALYLNPRRQGVTIKTAKQEIGARPWNYASR